MTEWLHRLSKTLEQVDFAHRPFPALRRIETPAGMPTAEKGHWVQRRE